MKKLLYVFLLLASVFTLVACGGGDKGGQVLVVGYDDFSEKFSPFFGTTAYDMDVSDMVSVGLMTTDRDGGIIYDAIEGETVARAGVDHFYQGWTKLTVTQNADTTVYNIKIRDDVKFSDGHVLDADDIIFSYYVYLDRNYTGSTTLNGVDIVGYQSYKYNNDAIEAGQAIAEGYLDAIGDSTDPNNSTELDTYVLEQIEGLLADEYGWVEDDVMTNAGYAGYWKLEDGSAYDAETNVEADASATATFAGFYSLLPLVAPEDDDVNDPTPLYSVVGKTAETVIAEIAAQYEYDYLTLDANYGADVVAPLISSEALRLALTTVDGNPVANISGINKLSSTEVEVTVNGFDAAAIYQVCGITVAPMHYYGNPDLYDYSANQFGFTREDLTIVREKTATPLGAGAYKFVKFEDNVVYFEANENYYKGEPKIPYINFQVVNEDAKVTGIQTGEIDISNPTGSKDTFAKVNALNEDEELVSISSIDNLGYGYIGINALNVQVVADEDNPKDSIGSDQSKALRKAFATVLASYRQTANNSYYGSAAQVINYPISNTSWAAPKPGEAGYEIAFVKNPTGGNIYGGDPADLTNSERNTKAKEGAKLWLEEAGYTFTEASGSAQFGGSLWTAVAPTGAKLTYEIIIPAGGAGEHPAFSIVTQFSNIMAELGITIVINDPANANVLWDTLDAGSQEMWAAAWGTVIDPDMYQIYHSTATVDDDSGSSTSNHYYIKSAALDTLIMDARASSDQDVRKGKYKEALDIIMDWAVEVPNYQRQNLIIFSTQRVNMETVTPAITTYWGWMNDIEKLELN